ncbi:(p)ppGpp synthetase, partial [Achromatium sp. WMS2]
KLVNSMARLDAVTTEQISQLTSANKVQTDQFEGLRRLLLGMVEDARAILVILAGRLHLLRASKNLTTEIQRQLALETQRIYSPLANRLGIWQIKWELEDMSLRFLEPAEYKRIANLLDGKRTERERYIGQVISILRDKFAESGIKASISGRPKHIYSIWRKMSRKKVDFDQIFDVRAVRVLVDTVADCYAALGIAHGLWQHIPGEFDDYIATPKANFYQSIHTAVAGPESGMPVEIQIR